jgi:hypothetical protein
LPDRPRYSTKTTILDAIELGLSPRSYLFADDADFYDLVVDNPIKISLTPTRLGSFAERHLGWGRQLILSKLAQWRRMWAIRSPMSSLLSTAPTTGGTDQE